jgi:hypothetical protein
MAMTINYRNLSSAPDMAAPRSLSGAGPPPARHGCTPSTHTDVHRGVFIHETSLMRKGSNRKILVSAPWRYRQITKEGVPCPLSLDPRSSCQAFRRTRGDRPAFAAPHTPTRPGHGQVARRPEASPLATISGCSGTPAAQWARPSLPKIRRGIQAVSSGPPRAPLQEKPVETGCVTIQARWHGQATAALPRQELARLRRHRVFPRASDWPPSADRLPVATHSARRNCHGPVETGSGVRDVRMTSPLTNSPQELHELNGQRTSVTPPGNAAEATYSGALLILDRWRTRAGVTTIWA